MKEHLQVIVTVLSLVNPVICGAMFARIEAKRSRAEQLADATKVALAMLAIFMAADVYFGRCQTILLQRKRIKRDTIRKRRLQHQMKAA